MTTDTAVSSGADDDKVQAAPDPLDLESLKLSQDFASTIGVKKVLTTIPCRKPNRHEFVRVRPGDDWHLETGIFEDKIQREIYLISHDMWGELAGEISPVCLSPTITKQGGHVDRCAVPLHRGYGGHVAAPAHLQDLIEQIDVCPIGPYVNNSEREIQKALKKAMTWRWGEKIHSLLSLL